MADDQTLDNVSVDTDKLMEKQKGPESSGGAISSQIDIPISISTNRGSGEMIDYQGKSHLIWTYKEKSGNYASEIMNPVTKKRIYLGTFATAEEASQAYQSKKLEFDKLVKEKQQGPVPSGGPLSSEIDIPISNSTNGGSGEMIDSQGKSHLIKACPITKKGNYLGTFATAEEASQAYQWKKLEVDKLVKERQQGPGSSDGALSSGIDFPISNSTDGGSGEMINSQGKSHFIGAYKKKSGNYASEIMNPITKKRNYLGTFGTAEEASQAYQSKKLEFDKLVKEKQQRPESSGGPLSSEIDIPRSNSTNGGSWEMIYSHGKSHLIGAYKKKSGNYASDIVNPITKKRIYLGTFATAEEASQAYQSKKLEFHKLVKEKQQGPGSSGGALSSEIDIPISNSTNGGRGEMIDSQGKSHLIGAYKRKSGNYASEIWNPITKKRHYLGTFGTAEEASQAYHLKKLEFQKLGKQKLQGPESSGGALSSEIVIPISNSTIGVSDQRVESHERSHNMDIHKSMAEVLLGTLGTCEEDLHAYQSHQLSIQSSKKVELQNNVATDSSAGEKQEGQENEDLLTGKWVQLPGDIKVKFSLKLGLPIIDNYGFLLGEFSNLDDLSICETEDENKM